MMVDDSFDDHKLIHLFFTQKQGMLVLFIRNKCVYDLNG
jgi:hypothetical protein